MSISRKDILAINQKGWYIVAPQFYGGTAWPACGPLAATEPELQLSDNLQNKSVLELGCGSGHTLRYLWKHKRPAKYGDSIYRKNNSALRANCWTRKIFRPERLIDAWKKRKRPSALDKMLQEVDIGGS